MEKSIFLFAAIWAVANSISKSAQGDPQILVVLIGSFIVGGLFALLVGKMVSIFTKSKQHIIGVANWLLLLGSGLTMIVAMLPLVSSNAVLTENGRVSGTLLGSTLDLIVTGCDNWGNSPFFEIQSLDGSFGFSYFPELKSYGGEFSVGGETHLIMGNKNSPQEVGIGPNGGFLKGVFCGKETPIEVDILFECGLEKTNY